MQRKITKFSSKTATFSWKKQNAAVSMNVSDAAKFRTVRPYLDWKETLENSISTNKKVINMHNNAATFWDMSDVIRN